LTQHSANVARLTKTPAVREAARVAKVMQRNLPKFLGISD
jgi:hypothetical protein